MTYQEAVEYIESLAPRGWRLGIDRMEEFAKRAGLIPSEQNFIHIAGTNGKGSTTAMVQSALFEQGFNVGAFFSPYVVDPRERVQIGRDMIPKEELANIAEYLKPIGESLSNTEFGGVTEFEFKTAIGLVAWKRNNCDWVALEVGLGGRLDATNIIEPTSCAIVSIGLDHMHILGNSTQEIAFEKAGILKHGKPGVIGEMPTEARTVIERRASEVGAPLWRVGMEVKYDPQPNGSVRVTTPRSEIELFPSLFGRVQRHNAAVAYAALELAGAVKDIAGVQRGFATAAIPGRYQRMNVDSKKWILDGAHNPDSGKILAQMLRQDGQRDLVCVTGMLAGHEPEEFYAELFSLVEEFWVVPIAFHRAKDPEEIADLLKSKGAKVRVFESTEAAVTAANHAEGTEGYLVSGSFYLVGEIMRQLQPAL